MFGNEYVQEEPRKLIKSKRFMNVAVGESCTLATTHTGDLFGWGSDLVDWKGSKATFKEPVPLLLEAKITAMSLGPRHAAMVNTKGEVFSWGMGGDWFRGGGQLGHGDRAEHKAPKKIEFFADYGAKIVSVGCGDKHTVFLTDDGEVLSCGLGEYGRTGTGVSSDCLEPSPLDSLESEDVVQIAVGFEHSLALTAKGDIFSWGRNQQGQLGHADSFMDMYSMEDFPRKIESEGLHGDDGVTTKQDTPHEELVFAQVAAGHSRSAAVTDDGHLFVWGARLSHFPKLVDKALFENLEVKKVLIGGDNGKSVIAAITEDGGLWTLGDARSKMLGRAGLSGKHIVPERVPFFKGKNVLDIYTGFGQHIFAKVLIEDNEA